MAAASIAGPTGLPRPLVLVHGLWDTPQLFRRLEERLGGRRDPLLAPHLPHGLGSRPLEALAAQLGREIEAAFGPERELDLLGFSMGGVIGRTWIQLLGGHRRTRRFISVGSPQNGTASAQPCPRWLLPGIADMKLGSPLIRRLNADLSPLQALDCRSFWCLLDTMVVPSWKGVLPVGRVEVLPVANHRHLITRPEALGPITAALLEP